MAPHLGKGWMLLALPMKVQITMQRENEIISKELGRTMFPRSECRARQRSQRKVKHDVRLHFEFTAHITRL